MKKTHIFLLLFLLFGSNFLRAQSAPAAPASAVQITLGHSVVALTGLWKFHIGDNPKWADPNFDDSGWGTVNLAPVKGSHDPFLGGSGYVPGWTARGYPGYHGYAWYRLRVNVQDGQSQLALSMPDDFDGAYQVYVNGRFLGQFGRFTSRGAIYYFPHPRVFPLDASIRNGPLTIAFRVWTVAANPLRGTQSAGTLGPPTLGQASVIDAMMLPYWNDVTHFVASVFLEMAILLLALLVALGLYALDHSEPAYLWLGLTCAALLSYEILVLLRSYTSWVSAATLDLLQGAVLTPLFYVTWVLFWGHWFRLDHMVRLRRLIWGLALLLAATLVVQRAVVYGHIASVHAAAWLSPLTLLILTPIAMLLVWVTVRGIRTDRTEGLLALPAVLLVAVSLYQGELAVLHIPIRFFPFGFSIALGQIANMLSLGIITVLLLRRFLHSQREREQWRLEMEQAREVQQMLIPVTPPNTPGFAVESVYLPAQKVGGDFFQIRPSDDGSLLIVVGDVSGKGLKAAMTVSTIVGALRNEKARQPAEVLANLNRVLHGQVGGFVTCCAVFIAPDGEMTLANAGHLSPYRNGEEMIVAGGLPLGILAEGSYEETHYQLAPGDRLTFVSDGVVEATNERKELFGFERTQAISDQPAAAIAEAAKNFGQEDDISVLSVTRNANMKAALA